MAFDFPVLVCDIGGTNARFSLKTSARAELSEPVHVRTHDYPGLAEAIAAILPQLAARPRAVIACGAGPIVDGKLKLTNAPWVIDGREVAQKLKLGGGLLLNDFEAQALSLPAIPDAWTRQIGPLGFGGDGPRVILGPGTGLGVAALIDASGRHTPVSSELCHIGFGPETAEEAAIWPHLERAHGRITTESVACGAGLARVYRASLLAKGAEPEFDDPAAVTAAALADRDGEAAQAVRLYWRIIGRLAGDVAISFVARGGVTLAGGVLPRIVDLLDEQAFRAAFEMKAPVDGLARTIPTRLVMRADSVLIGMAAIAADPERYAIDYAGRAWT
ncbi:MAG: glucokinase [Pseudomonadota bacterium]|nr:glucokinase [Pseudomonadota bacterium]